MKKFAIDLKAKTDPASHCKWKNYMAHLQGKKSLRIYRPIQSISTKNQKQFSKVDRQHQN
jgi:hypothetical protein